MNSTKTKESSQWQPTKLPSKPTQWFSEITLSRGKSKPREWNNLISTLNKTMFPYQLSTTANWSMTPLSYIKNPWVKILICLVFSLALTRTTYSVKSTIRPMSLIKGASKFWLITKSLFLKPAKSTMKSTRKIRWKKIQLLRLTRETDPLKMTWPKSQVNFYLFCRLQLPSLQDPAESKTQNRISLPRPSQRQHRDCILIRKNFTFHQAKRNRPQVIRRNERIIPCTAFDKIQRNNFRERLLAQH